MSSEDIYRDLQRIYLGKVDKVAPHCLQALLEERLITKEESGYHLTDAGEMIRMKLHKDGVRDTSFCTLGDMLRAKGQST